MNTSDLENLHTIIDTLDISIFTFNEKREVLFSNTAAKRSLDSELEGEPIGAAQEHHFEDNEYYDENGNKLEEYPNGSAIDRALLGEETHNLLLEHRNKKKHTHRWISIDCVPIKDENGKFLYGILWYRDVSTRKSREDKLKFLLDATGLLSIDMDLEKRLYEKARLAVPTLADWSSVELVQEDGSTRRIALINRDPKKIEYLLEYEKKYPQIPGTETGIQKVIRTKEAEFVPVVMPEMIDQAPELNEEQKEAVRKLELSSLMIIPIIVKDKVVGVLSMGYAESGRRYSIQDFNFFQEFAAHLSVVMENAQLYNEISRRDLQKDAFLASLSHELRNPLAPIRTNLELLKMRNPDQIFQEEINNLMHQFGHLTRLLNDLLESTRFTRGKIIINYAIIEVNKIVEQVVKSIRPMLEKAQISLQVSYPSKPFYIYGDHTRIEQTFNNIISNAIKFTPAGGTISIITCEVDGMLNLIIKDTGAGISKEDLEHIFEPYYQSEKNKLGNTGLGIGLYLVHQIITLHNGTIEAKSDGVGKGSEFSITLPLLEPLYESKTPTNTLPPEKSSNGIKKILVVDDNQAASDGMARLLTALGWNAHPVYSGAQALTYLETETPDVIFLDIGMPDMSGYEAIQKIREKEGFNDTPIIALTGYGLEEDKIKAIEAGFTAHLTKPVGTRELKEILTDDIFI